MSAADPDPRSSLPSAVKRILAIDGDESVATSVRKLVATHPCDVDWARDDAEGLRMIEASSDKPYNVIFVDLRFVTSSKSALSPLLRLAKPQLPMITTHPLGYDTSVSLVKARSLGISLFVYKPFRVDHFFSVINQLVRSRQ